MENTNNELLSRKKFITWGTGILSVFTTARIFLSPKEPQKIKTVKMLGQDGKLVEVDAEKLLGAKRKKITNEQLKNWVGKKQS